MWEQETDCLRCGCLLCAFFAGTDALTDRRSVQQDAHGKFLAVIRPALRDQLILQ